LNIIEIELFCPNKEIKIQEIELPHPNKIFTKWKEFKSRQSKCCVFEFPRNFLNPPSKHRVNVIMLSDFKQQWLKD